MTTYTLTSILNEDYFADEAPDFSFLYPKIMDLTTPPPAVAAAHAIGYQFYVVRKLLGSLPGPTREMSR